MAQRLQNGEKVLSLPELARRCEAYRRAGEVVVLCHGVFDLLHPGHIKHLEAARNKGDRLVVTITADAFVSKGPGRPVFNQRLRAETLAALASVDAVGIVHEPTAISAIEAVHPSLYVKGMDYSTDEQDLTGKIADERNAVERSGGRVVFTDEETFSSTALLNQHFSVFPPETEQFLSDFRRAYPLDCVLDHIGAVANSRVLVIGDAIVDEYVYCEAMGKSSKEYLVSTRYRDRERFAGGTHGVANHLAGICREVALLSVVGDDDDADFLASKLKPNVDPHVIRLGHIPTTRKTRFVDHAFMQKLFQVCTMDDNGLPPEDAKALDTKLTSMLRGYDFVVVSDFGHGMLNAASRETIVRDAPYLALNVQTNSANAGFNLVTGYRHADYVSVDEPEARLAMRRRTGDIAEIGGTLAESLSTKLLSITRGHRGALVIDDAGTRSTIPALSSEIVDRIGAGDAYLSWSSPLAAAGVAATVVGFVGNAAGALAVRTVGNREAVEPAALKKFITTLLR